MAKLKLITHNGSFHADDLFACATLMLLMKKRKQRYEIIRTRDKGLVEGGDIVFDVGGIYDPEQNRFDHHQRDGAGKRDNGIPHSSFGLVWKHFGAELCDGKVRAWQSIDQKVVTPIDAIDNGVDIVEPKYKGIFPYNLDQNFLIYAPTWKETDVNTDKIFEKQAERTAELLARHIKVECDDAEGEELILKCYERAEDKRIIELDHSFSRYLYQRVLSGLPEPIYLMYQSGYTDHWKVEAVTKSPETLKSRKLFPESWRGFMIGDKGFTEVTGVSDVLFCHRSGFILSVGSREGALTLAKKALNS